MTELKISISGISSLSLGIRKTDARNSKYTTPEDIIRISISS
jgi:hypothetical protein